MEFNEELDYEEYDLQSTEFNDEYLQIDISKEEENFLTVENNREGKKEISSKVDQPNNNNNNNSNNSYTTTPTNITTFINKNYCNNSLKNKSNCSSDNTEQNNGARRSNVKQRDPKLHIKMSGKDVGTVKNEKKRLYNNYQITKSKEGFGCAKYSRKYNFVIESGFSKVGVKRCDIRNLPEGEKKIGNLKKEARLKRFMRENSLEKNTWLLDSRLQSYKGAEKDFLVKAQNSFTDKIPDVPPQEKPDINKELLLRKKNPFDDDLEIKQENEKNNVKGSIKLIESKTQQELLEKEKGDISGCQDSTAQGILKNDVDSTCVKFVRTVSKSLCELSFKNQHCLFEKFQGEGDLVFSKFLKTPASSNSKNLHFTIQDTQVPSQLIGSIVKVLNIPPSTTVSEVLALCKPIGVVSEIKLNYPKENSVVIRFAESRCAENFFKVYHGQKMNNYFLNVIVV